MLRNVVVVGASLAGLRAVETLRAEGFVGRLTLVGAEPHLPYDRPPLSKKFLSGEWESSQISLRKADEFAGLDLDLRLGVRAESLDTGARRIGLDDDSMVDYDGLVIATGASCRRLPGQPSLPGIFELRSLDDSMALRESLSVGSGRLVVIGAGFIGSEVAATAAGRGFDVTIVEALPVPLARGLGEQMGGAVAALHEANGVRLIVGVGVDGFDGTTRVEGVRLTDGSTLPADLVVVGVGVSPNTGWLADSGIELGDGVICDEQLATSAPGVFAAGDLVRWPNRLFDEQMRVEHWTNAAEQGAEAARNLLASADDATGTPYAPVPFFWSDQYDARIQFLGRSSPGDEVVVVKGSTDSMKWVALYRNGDRLHGALGISSPRDVMPYRRMLAAAASWDDAMTHATSVA